MSRIAYRQESGNTVGDLIARRPTLKFHLGQTVDLAIAAMEIERQRAVGIVYGAERFNDYFCGLFTYGDFIRRVVGKGRIPARTPLIDVITWTPLTVTPDCTYHEAFDIMTEQDVSHLPVVVDGRLRGIVCEDDLRLEIARGYRKLTADHNLLLSYIYGEPYGIGAVY